MSVTRKRTILVVDDELDVVKSVQDLLRFDYRVLGATRAEQGLALMEQEEVHIVMSDQRMPGMSGVEFLRRVRGDYPEAIRLLFTGYADIRAVIEAINQGNVYRYITKPWDADELQVVIREAVERYDLLVERRRLMDELHRKNEQLQAANAELQQADQLKSAFIQVASHELRTPLTILLGLLRLASRVPDVKDPLGDWVRRSLSAAERLQGLVNQIVTMMTAGRFDQSLRRESVNLRELLEQAVADVRPFVELRHQQLDLSLPDTELRASLDAAKIRDCLNHLLLNAIKFTPDGGQVTLALSVQERDVLIGVSDNGVGIEPEAAPHIFEPFFTDFNVSHHSTGLFEYGRKGLGLGLSVVKAFIELHGGTIDFQSTPGQGTTFTLRLPGALQTAWSQGAGA